MGFLNQSSFPKLWSLFQLWIGGTVDKRRLYLKLLENHGVRLLEIGCSTGNTAEAFASVPSLEYVGLDIDDNAIREATRKFKGREGFQFVRQDLNLFCQIDQLPYDFILFGNIAHHVPDHQLKELLDSAVKLMHRDSVLVIVDPLKPERQDSWLIKFYAHFLEKGEYLRSWEQTESILNEIQNTTMHCSAKHNIGATPWSWPLCAKFSSHTLKLK